MLQVNIRSCVNGQKMQYYLPDGTTLSGVRGTLAGSSPASRSILVSSSRRPDVEGRKGILKYRCNVLVGTDMGQCRSLIIPKMGTVQARLMHEAKVYPRIPCHPGFKTLRQQKACRRKKISKQKLVNRIQGSKPKFGL